MTMLPSINSPSKGNYQQWADNITQIVRQLVQKANRAEPQIVSLEHITDEAKATQDGLMMWDAVAGCPVVSVDGEWKKVTLAP